MIATSVRGEPEACTPNKGEEQLFIDALDKTLAFVESKVDCVIVQSPFWWAVPILKRRGYKSKRAPLVNPVIRYDEENEWTWIKKR